MGSGGINPIIPSWWDLGLFGAGVLALVLFIVALVSIVRSRLTRTMKLLCALLVLAMPFLGSIVWFASRKSLEGSLNRTG